MAEKKEQQENAPEKKKNLGLILQLAFMLGNLSVLGVGSFLVYSSTIGWESPKLLEEQAARELASQANSEDNTPLIYTMEKFTVNLEGEPRRTIRLEVNLQMLGKEGFEEVMEPDNRARARDGIIRILNEKGFSDLDSIQGKLFLKDRIIDEVNQILKRGIVKEVYFSDFVVQ